ncbi:uncharacterized protein FOMMEDRAFT_150828 [Fomitiporia mediterranea MF3/22]|uniref:uncharacterized protein n=1 Tax=Fomitiporia mediterranea (strain MF3/22) TaxID=694068 RepID=UPI00044088D6|nr:uncharacterized protein FOMMEDRAFT_150828 [Fomitiporia mediterranea MF3/22]EJD08135.1 hypothetical protein FOMMEDRAFT_150828 [Fomitiporia mediterranea MF3/22]
MKINSESPTTAPHSSSNCRSVFRVPSKLVVASGVIINITHDDAGGTPLAIHPARIEPECRQKHMGQDDNVKAAQHEHNVKESVTGHGHGRVESPEEDKSNFLSSVTQLLFASTSHVAVSVGPDLLPLSFLCAIANGRPR